MVERFPAAQAHVGFCPVGFERPAYLITCPKVSRTDASRTTVLVNASVAIGFFTPLNDYQLPDCDELTEAQNAVIDIFRQGYIRVGDRCLRVKAATGSMAAGEAYVDLQIEFFDDRDPEALTDPMIQTVETTTKLN